ncbi:histidine--tRNA ligase [Pseudochelatococcus contaminans]|uniref:Histidine--tRNA ligase n=1 Tax=Pseudochelatococcus contaminans TaxID=1538103 RepID=A0A7W6EEG8_9HYPH|nr:histidine--tRNA ligase [Pseudochelatococcus contaminans]MBB3808218.1 histidyl-tRNA synthetase [Pseudochelatococcus contaminans]
MSGPENQKPQKLLARQPRGFADRGPADIAATERMLAHIRETYELYGFDAVETPFVEYTDALGKFLPDQDRPNEGVFSFQDDDEQWLSLRYDLTAPLARHVAENYDTLPKPYRSYRAGWVFRNEKPGPGRFRQFMQFDADTVGAASVSADAEICMMAADTLERVGIARGDYAVKINNRKVLDGVLEAIGLADDIHTGKRLTVLRAIDKLDRLGPEGVTLLLGEGRKDESGDYTKGAGLDAGQIARVLAFTAARGATADETLANLEQVVEGSARGLEGVSELREIATLVTAAGYDDGRVTIDPAVVRGLEYYTGPVYEAELTFIVAGDDGQPVRFGSVAGGGRYDGLVARFRGEPVPATGFSIGVSRLLAALKIVGSPIVQGAAPIGPVVVLVLDRDQIAHYQGLVTTLRQAGIRAELYLGASGLKAQMKYADRRQSPAVVIQGSNERAEGIVQIKDLVAGSQQAAQSGQDLDNAAYKAQRLAQFSVKESELVDAVRGVLDNQGG